MSRDTQDASLQGASSPRRGAVPARRPRVGVVGVLGELLITAGVFVLLFIGWQVWLNDLVLGNEQGNDALRFSQELESDAPAEPAPAAGAVSYGDPVVTAVAAPTEKFATIYIPRFGSDWVRTIAEGTGVSDVLKTGVGHYPGTQMPGEVGNFAVAAHRTTWGGPFKPIADLKVGDRIYVQTADGWYTYVFRTLEYVRPTAIEVIEPVPQTEGITATDRVLTMTSCNPLLSAAERIVAYSTLDSWQPLSAGAPAEIAELAGSGA
jgi:sortase A